MRVDHERVDNMPTTVGNSIVMTEVNSDHVIEAIIKLKTNHVKGSDGIPAFCITDCGEVLSEPLSNVFNLCIRSEVFSNKYLEIVKNYSHLQK